MDVERQPTDLAVGAESLPARHQRAPHGLVQDAVMSQDRLADQPAQSRDVTEKPDPESLSIDRLAGDSTEQRRAESLMLDLLEGQLHCRLKRPWRRSLPDGGRLEVDGGTDDPEHPLLVEVWAHQGPPKPAQKAKVLTDAFKLSFAATLVPRRPRLLLLFSDQEAAAPFRSPRTWSAAAIRQAGIEVMVVILPEQERAKIRDAQRRQYR